MQLNTDHFQIIKDSLTSDRDTDEQSFASLAVLDERLKHVRQLGGRFRDIAFSSAVENLKKQRNRVALV